MIQALSLPGLSMLLPLAQIRRENDLQARDQSHWTRDGAERTALDPAHVAALVEVLRSGRTFSTRPIVYQDEAGYWLADGWHRLAAYEVVGQTEIEVEIREGGRRGAFRHALGANAEHGKPRTQKDKRRAVDLALGDAELGNLSNREIGDITGTSHTFVAGRRELRAAGEAMRQAAPRSRALGLAKARAALVCALNGAESVGVETFDLPGRPGQEVALWYDGINELSREEIDEAIQALGDAHRAKTVPLYRQPPPRPDPLPGQQLLTGGEVPAVAPASERRAESRALGARIGRCIAALRLMDPHDLVHLGGDVGLVEAGILLGSATSAPWAEIELATLEAALFPTVTPDRDDGPGSLVALESTCPQPATSSPSSPTATPPAGDADASRMSPETGTVGSATTATTAPASPRLEPSMPSSSGSAMSPAGMTSPALTATTERDPRVCPAAGDRLVLPDGDGQARVLGVLPSVRGWDVRIQEVTVLGAPDGTPYSIGLVEWWNRHPIAAGDVRLERSGDHVLVWRQGALPDYAGRPVRTIEEAIALLAVRREPPAVPEVEGCTACSEPTDRYELSEGAAYALCWACAIQARDEMIAHLRADDGSDSDPSSDEGAMVAEALDRWRSTICLALGLPEMGSLEQVENALAVLKTSAAVDVVGMQHRLDAAVGRERQALARAERAEKELAQLRIRADQVPTLEADLAKAHERAETLAVQLQQAQEEHRWAIEAGRTAAGEAAKWGQERVEALQADLASIATALGKRPDVDAKTLVQQVRDLQTWGDSMQTRAKLAENKLPAPPATEMPAGWPEGWIADPDVSGIVHAAWNAPRRPDGHRGPSAVIYTATDGTFEPTMELIDEDCAEDAAELLRRMAWGLAGRPLPEPAPTAEEAARVLAESAARMSQIRARRDDWGEPATLPPDPMAIYRPWKGSADELAAQLNALGPADLEQVRLGFTVAPGARLVERLTVAIRRGGR